MNAPEKLTTRVKLPSSAGKFEEFRLSAPRDFGTAGRKAFNRIALAAAHVVADPLARGNPWLDAAVDWDATLAYRRYLWSLGLGVAEAMDRARRPPRSLRHTRSNAKRSKASAGGSCSWQAARLPPAPARRTTIGRCTRASSLG